MSATIGVIGLGYWGPNLLRNFAATPGWTVKYGCDLDDRRLANFRRQYPSVTYTTDAGTLMNDPGLTAIAIATPIESHFSLARTALERGKHGLIEKPLAETTAEADALIRIAEANGRLILVDHTFVYTGAVRKIRELVTNGDLGDLYYFDSTRINMDHIQTNKNVLWEKAIHDLANLWQISYLTTLRSLYAHGSRH